jgi:hypothetical protein
MNLKRNFAAALLLCAAAVPALAAVSISVGEPGFFGTIDLGGGPPPQVINAQPVIVGPPVVNAPPVYLRVPVAQQHDWRRYCGQYNACGRPAYFVHEDWYRSHYAGHAPVRREEHARDERREDERR